MKSLIGEILIFLCCQLILSITIFVTYRCTTCGQSFAQSTHLKNHERIHSGEKPFTCEVCHKDFARYSTLWNHRRVSELNYWMMELLTSSFFHRFIPAKSLTSKLIFRFRWLKTFKIFASRLVNNCFLSSADVHGAALHFHRRLILGSMKRFIWESSHLNVSKFRGITFKLVTTCLTFARIYLIFLTNSLLSIRWGVFVILCRSFRSPKTFKDSSQNGTWHLFVKRDLTKKKINLL